MLEGLFASFCRFDGHVKIVHDTRLPHKLLNLARAQADVTDLIVVVFANGE
jgi:hypothetical protein